MSKRYLAISALDNRDELYYLTKSKLRHFEKLFGDFDSVWSNHDEAIKWLRVNAKFVDYCTCLT